MSIVPEQPALGTKGCLSLAFLSGEHDSARGRGTRFTRSTTVDLGTNCTSCRLLTIFVGHTAGPEDEAKRRRTMGAYKSHLDVSGLTRHALSCLLPDLI